MSSSRSFSRGLLLAPTWSGKTSFDLLSDTVVHGFSAAAGQASSNSGYPINTNVTPDCVLAQGLGYSAFMVGYAYVISNAPVSTTGTQGLGVATQTWANGNLETPQMYLAVFAIGCTMLAFVVMAGQLVLVQIEAYLVLGLGMLLTGFAGSRWTLSMAEKYWTYAIGVGIKMMVIYAVLTFAQTVMNQQFLKMLIGLIPAATLEIANALKPPGPLTSTLAIPLGVFNVIAMVSMIEVAVGSAVLAIVCWQSSSIAGGLISGTSSMSFANGMSALAGVASGIGQMAYGAAMHHQAAGAAATRDAKFNERMTELGMTGHATNSNPSGIGQKMPPLPHPITSASNPPNRDPSSKLQVNPNLANTLPGASGSEPNVTDTPKFGYVQSPDKLNTTTDAGVLQDYSNPKHLDYLTMDQQMGLATNPNLDNVLGKGPANELRNTVAKNLEKSHMAAKLGDSKDDALAVMMESQGLKAALPTDNQNFGAVQIRFKHSGRDE